MKGERRCIILNFEKFPFPKQIWKVYIFLEFWITKRFQKCDSFKYTFFSEKFQKLSKFSIFHFFEVRVHFFRQNFQKISIFFDFSWKTIHFVNFSRIFKIFPVRVHFFGNIFRKFQNFRFFMKKHPLCELFLNFQNLKLSIMMLSPRSKQNQQADSLVDSFEKISKTKH